MARMAAMARREQIVAAAVRVVMAKGLAAATTRDVTREAGIAAGLLTHYFTWNALRAEAFLQIARADLAETLLERSSTRASVVLDRLVTSAFSPAAEPIWRLWLEAVDLSSGDEALDQAVAVVTADWRSALAELLRRGASDKDWICDDPEGASWRTIAILIGLSGLTMTGHAVLSPASAAEHLSIAIRHELRG